MNILDKCFVKENDLWQLINGQTTARELAEAVRNEYDVEAAEAEKDVVDFLRSLEEAGLIRSSEAIQG
jgi:hypothetical protein